MTKSKKNKRTLKKIKRTLKKNKQKLRVGYKSLIKRKKKTYRW
jgi:hypothetical protein